MTHVVTIEIAADGTVRWNGEVLPDADALDRRLAEVGSAPVPPEVRLRGNLLANHGEIGAVMAAARRHNVRTFGLIDVTLSVE